MPRSAPALRLDLDRARAHWHRSQGLAEPTKGSLAEVIAATGWLRTLGGVDVYLAARARVPGLRRADLDGAVEPGELRVVPAARGCIYLVPRASVPLALRIADDLSRRRLDRDLSKVGVPASEMDAVAEAAVKALGKATLSTDALRKALPSGVARSLGEAGKKIGMSSTLPQALRRLEFAGRIERTLEGGRLDSERYEWRLLKKKPAGDAVPEDAADRHGALAAIFFRHAGPASLADFAAWSGLSQRDARAGVERAPLVPVAVDGYAPEAFALEAHLPALRERAAPSEAISLLPFEDNFVTLHGGPAAVVEARHHHLEVGVWGFSKGSTLGDARHIQMRSLVVGDQLAGLWEHDAAAGGAVIATFAKLPAARRRAAQAQADAAATFLRDELGHARSFSLDTTEAVAERAEQIRAMPAAR